MTEGCIHRSLLGLGRGAGQDSSETRRPVQVCPRLLQLQANREVSPARLTT